MSDYNDRITPSVLPGFSGAAFFVSENFWPRPRPPPRGPAPVRLTPAVLTTTASN
jgi:hypothetical protein